MHSVNIQGVKEIKSKMKEKPHKELSEDKAFKKGMGRQVKILKADRISVLTQSKVEKEIFKPLKRTLPSKEIKM